MASNILVRTALEPNSALHADDEQFKRDAMKAATVLLKLAAHNQHRTRAVADTADQRNWSTKEERLEAHCALKAAVLRFFEDSANAPATAEAIASALAAQNLAALVRGKNPTHVIAAIIRSDPRFASLKQPNGPALWHVVDLGAPPSHAEHLKASH